MSQVGDVLRRAAARVERPGGGWVPGHPLDFKGQVCAVTSVMEAANDRDYQSALQALGWTVSPKAKPRKWGRIATWNLEQPSRAVVAAEMRSAADLADLLYG